jgi:hypothetical protein
MSCLDRFLNHNWDFWDWKVVSRQNQDFSISIETSWSSTQAFWNCRDFLNRWDLLSASVKIESLDRDHVKTNWDPQALKLVKLLSLWVSTVETNQDFKICQEILKNWEILMEIEKKLRLLVNLDRSQSWSRLLWPENGVETRSKFLNLDWGFSIVETIESVNIFSTVETYFLQVSISRLLIETRSRQIKNPKLKNWVVGWG